MKTLKNKKVCVCANCEYVDIEEHFEDSIAGIKILKCKNCGSEAIVDFDKWENEVGR